MTEEQSWKRLAKFYGNKYWESEDRITHLEVLMAAQGKTLMKLSEYVSELEEALQDVINVADRDCPEFRKAKSVLEGEPI